MRIVSWNKNGKLFGNTELSKMLDAVKADVIVFQEYSPGTSAKGWSFMNLAGSGGQDGYSIGIRNDHGEIDHAHVKKDPRGSDAKDIRGFLVARITYAGESVTLVTCHAPHLGGGPIHSAPGTIEYMDSLEARLGESFRVKEQATDAGGATTDAAPPAKKKKAKSKSAAGSTSVADATRVVADLFMGDTNLYGAQSGSASKWLPTGWADLRVGATSGKGTGNPLDRIGFKQGADAFDEEKMRYGRIYHGDKSELKGQKDSKAVDVEPEASKNEYAKSSVDPNTWLVSDHLAIYFDTGKGTKPAAADTKDAVMDDATMAVPQGAMNLRNRAVPKRPLEVPAAAGAPPDKPDPAKPGTN